MIIKICLFCKSSFETRADRGIYCSLKCRGLAGRKREKRTCLKCQKEFETVVSNKKGKFCSAPCKNYYRMNVLYKGENHWFWGKQRSPEEREKMSKSGIGKHDGEKNGMWKGNSVGIPALHSWVKRKLGVPRICEHCGTKNAPKFDWANKSGDYRRDLDDWIRLCAKCHKRYDIKRLKALGWHYRKK